MPKTRPLEGISVFKETNDDWCGNYRIVGDMRVSDLVHVSFLELSWDAASLWRVCVWGNDDLGLELDFSSRNEAFDTFLKVISWPYVSQKSLRDIGFVGA
jgi:hypothetical protein